MLSLFPKTPAQKSFYVDEYEKPEQRQAKKLFAKQYLIEWEPRTFGFLQLPAEAFAEMKWQK